MPSSYGNSRYTTTYINGFDVFNVDWLYSEVFNETVKAEIEVHKLRNETKNSITESKKTAETEKTEPRPPQ